MVLQGIAILTEIDRRLVLIYDDGSEWLSFSDINISTFCLVDNHQSSAFHGISIIHLHQRQIASESVEPGIIRCMNDLLESKPPRLGLRSNPIAMIRSIGHQRKCSRIERMVSITPTLAASKPRLEEEDKKDFFSAFRVWSLSVCLLT